MVQRLLFFSPFFFFLSLSHLSLELESSACHNVDDLAELTEHTALVKQQTPRDRNVNTPLQESNNDDG